MNDLVNSIAVLGKPYNITRSRLGAITKVIENRYICDLPATKELCQSIGEKLSEIRHTKTPEFSFLISFQDKTHHDGVTDDLQNMRTMPIGKQTDRVVIRWVVHHKIEDFDNELAVTVRISNPVNPLVFLQAALSKSPSEIDNMEFEMGSTCITVDGATQGFADEIFLRVQKWIDARNKPHAYISAGDFYEKYEWYFDQFNSTIFPLLFVTCLSIYSMKELNPQQNMAAIPIIMALYFSLKPISAKVNTKMANWAKKSKYISLFQITNGDIDALTKLAATAKNSVIKLSATTIFSFLMNVIAGIVVWKLTTA
ncbi:MAG: hypothetical protein ACOZAQ_04325 [Pseudomonadota bacterium]